MIGVIFVAGVVLGSVAEGRVTVHEDPMEKFRLLLRKQARECW